MNLLQDISDRLLRDDTSDLSNWVIVFPNKRAGLFFKKLLTQQIEKPIWSPNIISINELFEKHSPYTPCDKFTLIYKLYQIIGKYYSEKESFEQFFFWGETLLADFDEIDKFLIDAKLLFQDLSNIKELEDKLEHLSENQIALIKKYWKSFDGALTGEKQKTLSLWKVLYPVYHDFSRDLENSNQAYPGMMHRWVAENLENGIEIGYPKILFAGFNALSASEEKLMSWCKANLDCEIFWDVDDFYLNDDLQEAGRFLRQYKRDHPTLSRTFKNNYESNAYADRSINVIECSTNAGQAQETGRLLQKLIEDGADPEQIAVVLPEEKLLLPVLSVIPKEIDSLNITMGYPLQNSLAYSFLISLLELQKEDESGRAKSFYYKNVLKILSHPFVFNRSDHQARELIQKIKKENILFPSHELLQRGSELFRLIFKRITGAIPLIDYLQNCLLLAAESSDETGIENEFIFQFYKLLNNLRELFVSNSIDISYKAFIRLLNHAIYRERLPFEGEPLKGLQIMGFMETRNLNFEHFILLSASEGVLPPGKQEISFVPYAMRKAYGLPTIDHADSIYAYLFYRIIHNCKRLTLLYNGNSEGGNSGELSRFVRQLSVETGLNIRYQTQKLNVFPSAVSEIKVEKSPEILKRLDRYIVQSGKPQKRLSPSAINSYLDCSLKFYFRYVLDLYEEDEMEENIYERELGLLFHRVMELIYAGFDSGHKKDIKPTDIDHKIKNVDLFIEEAFREHYHKEQTEKLELSGQSEMAYGVVKELTLQVLSIDKKYAPFEIIGLEADEKKGYFLDFEINQEGDSRYIGLKGIIDRIDQKEGITRILDYKTGRDTREYVDIESLYNQDDKSRNKAVFQTFLYALIFLNTHPGHSNNIQVGLFNLKDLYNDEFDVLIKQKHSREKIPVTDVKPFLEEYKNYLKELLQEIFSSNIGFVQTDDLSKCQYCPYIDICNREEK